MARTPIPDDAPVVQVPDDAHFKVPCPWCQREGHHADLLTFEAATIRQHEQALFFERIPCRRCDRLQTVRAPLRSGIIFPTLQS